MCSVIRARLINALAHTGNGIKSVIARRKTVLGDYINKKSFFLIIVSTEE